MNGARHDMGLGTYPTVTLAEARIAAADARKLIARGSDPLSARASSRRAAKPVPTFQEIAQEVIAEAQRKSTNAKVRYQWERHLGSAYCEPLLPRQVDDDPRHCRHPEAGLEQEARGRTQTLSSDPARV